MKRVRVLVIVAVVAASVMAAAVLHVAAAPSRARAQSKMSAPEHARLIAMCGTWEVEVTFWFQPGRPGLTTKGTSTIRPLLDGLFVGRRSKAR